MIFINGSYLTLAKALIILLPFVTQQGYAHDSVTKKLTIFTNILECKSMGYSNTNTDTNGELLVAENFIPEGAVVIDAGANVGQWSSLVSNNAKPEVIYAFEPVPSTCNELSSNTLQMPVTVHNLALSDSNGTAEFIWYPNRSTVSTFHKGSKFDKDPKKWGTTKRTLISVQTIKLDTFCENNDIKKIEFLKVDTEGHEYFVLQGAEELLKQKRIQTIQFEYSKFTKAADTTLRIIYELLTECGFEVYRILPKGLLHLSKWDDSFETFTYSNYLAVLKEER